MPRQSNLRYSVQPLVGDAAFEVVSFTLDEALSTPFKLNLELVPRWPRPASACK
ncbi:hypothetical protein OIU19_16320 [Pseudomonas sp. BT-42-2]|uniref:hypothetical protein n=1 Tax=Pseudomonas sp. BT-42-2 TaxID=2986927 RepID=UPI0021F6D817|nr:hypothetical protein [Pseudomonas sp. BT-42-2]MCV9920357.1 hypothetical protein [Pseudomonas sp. BT-42-2]